ncbi:hypothetical protein BJY00DRAFT_299753 [Aspergillus carlsbadensis]|nr:hypothetical protein BJY00DRAFT_299753 [Aspergillus carlsbadensis]
MSPVDHISLDRVPDSLRIVREIHLSEASSILEIELEGHKCAMKLFHDNGDPGVAENGRDLNRFRCELNAYMKLQKHKVYEAGFVPYFYGHIDRVNPSLFQPELRDFTHDKFHPSAIVLEYFPNAEGLNCENYSDVSYQRLVWVDFDVATTISTLGPKEQRQSEYEDELVAGYGEALRDDQREGLPKNTKWY